MAVSNRKPLTIAAAAVTATAVAGVAVASRRAGTSVRGWVVTRLVVPLLFGKGDGSLARMHERLAQDRAAGPALAPGRLGRKYAITDGEVSGVRCFSVAPRAGGTGDRILYLHGGAYVFDFMATHWPVVTGLVDRTDAMLVAPIYPLAPEHDVDEGLAAVERVYRALVAEVGADRVVVAGDSAGGGLALAFLHRLRDAGQALPRRAVLFFPWLDATVGDPEQPALEALDPILSIAMLRAAGRLWAAGRQPADPRVSPLFGEQADLPPLLALVGTHDLLLPDSRRLKACCPAVELREYPGMIHGWICAPIPEARAALDEAAAFLTARGAQADPVDG